MLKKILLSGIFLAGLSVPVLVLAQCPVCTIAVAGGVGLARYLGISDLISGLWVGALIVLMIMWTLKWLNKKNIKFPFRRLVVIFLFYFLTIPPLYWTHLIGQPENKFLGIDKLTFGTIVGSIIFLIGYWLENSFLRKRKQGKAHFPFQKVIIPISFLIVFSVIFYFIP